MSKFEIFQDDRGEWRFNLKASNGEVVAVSEGYSSKQSCLNGVEAVRNAAKEALVEERV